jgi:cysteine desulfurase
MKLPIYMDYHATTPVDQRVVGAMLPFFTEHFGNSASLQHRFGWIAKEAVESARKNIASILNAEPKEIIFTSGATESNNLALKSIAEKYRSNKNHIITTSIEHPSVLNSCKKLEQEGFSVTYLPVDSFGKITVDDIQNAITEKTFLVSVIAANNEIGTIQPIKEIGKLCSDHGILFHTDATQAIGKIPIDVIEMNIHLLSFASHKIYGPKGVGALYVRSKNPRVNLTAQIDGGGHEHNLRSGTLNVSGIVGFGKAVSLSMENLFDENLRLVTLRNLLFSELQKIESISLNGHSVERLSNNLNVTFHGVNADMMMTELSDIAISSGSACTNEDTDSTYSHVLKAIGLNKEAGQSTIRFGLGRFTTKEEVYYVAQRVAEVAAKLRMLSEVGV